MKIYVQSITNFLLCDKFLHNRQGFRNNEFIPCFVPQIAEHNLMRLQAHKTTKFLLNANLCTVSITNFPFCYKLRSSQKFRNTTIFIPYFCATNYKTSIECEFPIHSKLQNFHNSQEFRSNKFISFITCEKMRNLQKQDLHRK